MNVNVTCTPWIMSRLCWRERERKQYSFKVLFFCCWIRLRYSLWNRIHYTYINYRWQQRNTYPMIDTIRVPYLIASPNLWSCLIILHVYIQYVGIILYSIFKQRQTNNNVRLLLLSIRWERRKEFHNITIFIPRRIIVWLTLPIMITKNGTTHRSLNQSINV